MKFNSKKFIFYIFFIALGTVTAEVFSYNYPTAIIAPWGYLPYGLLYILFIDSLIRRRIRDWKTVYLYGVLVGFITEAFAAKVIFFGWEDSSFSLFGFAPAEALFLTFVFHPLVSFILPVRIAQEYFDYPFALTRMKHPRLLLLLWIPLYLLIAGSTGVHTIGSLLLPTLLTLLVFMLWMSVLKQRGFSESITLKTRTRNIWRLVTLAFYVFAWFFFDTGYRDEILFPAASAAITAVLFTGFVFFMVWCRTGKFPETEIFYTPTFDQWKYAGYCILIGGLYLLALFFPLGWLFYPVFIGGMVAGPVFFIYTVIETFIHRESKMPRLDNRGTPIND